VAAPRQLDRRLPGPGPDLEDAAARWNGGERCEVVVDPRRVRRPGTVVPLGDRPEGLPQTLAIGVLCPDSMMLVARVHLRHEGAPAGHRPLAGARRAGCDRDGGRDAAVGTTARRLEARGLPER